MGNYSLFVRPGMKRVNIHRNDNLSPEKICQDVMLSAFTGGKDKLVIVAVNYTNQVRTVNPQFKNFKTVKKYRTYVTSAGATNNLTPSAEQKLNGSVSLQPRSVTTIIFN